MSNRVYVVAAEYSAPLASLASTPADGYRGYPGSAEDPELWQRLFFTAPAEGMPRSPGAASPPSLTELLASAAQRALGSLHDLTGGDSYESTCAGVTDLLVASMQLQGPMPAGNVNAGLIPLMLRATLGLHFECYCQFVAGTADSGASALASAVRIAKERPATVLVTAGQLMPSGYTGQYRIRSVFAEDEQMQGLDMMAIGDVLMDALRRSYAGPGVDLAACQRWLGEVRRRKMAAAAAYPAALGLAGGDPGNADKLVTRYFRSADVAKAVSGAAAVVITSDPALLARARGRSGLLAPRYRNTPVVEVMGVGEGNTNPRVLSRRTPLPAVPSLRQALVTTAERAELPLSVYPDSAFAVLDDAFASMELAFLLAIGLDWQRATLRMTTWWSNPYGGLLAFGYAVGASGLVQVAQAFHIFAGDRRYILPTERPMHRFRREGSYSFTTSVGGPLSHVVVAILRGGVPQSAADQAAFFDEPLRPSERRWLAAGELARRTKIRRTAQVYAERLAEHRPGLWLIEGAMVIDPRSCAHALEPELVARLQLERLAGLVRPEHLDACTREVRALIAELRAGYLDHLGQLAAGSSEGVLNARMRYNDGLAGLLDAWRARGAARPDAEIHAELASSEERPAATFAASRDEHAEGSRAAPARPPAGDAQAERRGLIKALKQCIRVPAVMLIEPGTGTRRLRFLETLRDLDTADFVRVLPGRAPALVVDDGSLPWWNSRAERPDGPVPLPLRAGAEPYEVYETLMQPRPLAHERRTELAFLRAYFAPSGPQAAVDLAMRDLGVPPAVGTSMGASEVVPSIFYKNDIISSSAIPNVHEAYELLGRAVQRTRGWFGMYASTCAQHGDSVSLVSLDRRLEPAGADEALHARREAISNASRFARDVAEWCMRYEIRLRTVVSFGQGVAYRDVNDERSVASDSAIRGARLLDYVAAHAAAHGFSELPWLVFDWTELADIADAVETFSRELGAAVGPGWRSPSGPASPVALGRWSDIRFTVWYRPNGRE